MENLTEKQTNINKIISSLEDLIKSFENDRITVAEFASACCFEIARQVYEHQYPNFAEGKTHDLSALTDAVTLMVFSTIKSYAKANPPTEVSETPAIYV